MNCWICGEEGDSGEHLIKASDVRSMFNNISQHSPIYYHSEEKKNIPMGSAKASRLKSKALICTNCNNNRTAPHDKAWSMLSEHLRQYPLHKRGPLNIRFSKIFENNVYINSLFVHLYFVKLFGCRITEESIPIETESLSSAILNNKPNPFVFINFKKAVGNTIKHLSLTPVYLQKLDNQTIAAAWFYAVGDLNIEIIYSQNGAAPSSLKDSFHPEHKCRIVKFIDFDEDDNE